jgi:hypothetical protein
MSDQTTDAVRTERRRVRRSQVANLQRMNGVLTEGLGIAIYLEARYQMAVATYGPQVRRVTILADERRSYGPAHVAIGVWVESGAARTWKRSQGDA